MPNSASHPILDLARLLKVSVRQRGNQVRHSFTIRADASNETIVAKSPNTKPSEVEIGKGSRASSLPRRRSLNSLHSEFSQATQADKISEGLFYLDQNCYAKEPKV